MSLAWVLVNSEHGTLIVNRFDAHPSHGYGVGNELMAQGAYHRDEVLLILQLLRLRREHFGDGVFAIDGGANIGIHTVTWSRHMSDWGRVLAFEPQERIYYALAGNLALNNCHNARARNAALGAFQATIRVPRLDYQSPGSYGSLELRPTERPDIGQSIDYTKGEEVSLIALDSLDLLRVDLIKLDLEGMELEALNGAVDLIEAKHPILVIEHIKCGRDVITANLEPLGYKFFDAGMNVVAVHSSDPTLLQLKG